MTKSKTVAAYVALARVRLASAVLAAEDPSTETGDVCAELTLIRQHMTRLALALMKRENYARPSK